MKSMNTTKLAERLQRYRGRYPDIAKGTGLSYSTIRKLACDKLPGALPQTIAAVVDWMRKNRP